MIPISAAKDISSIQRKLLDLERSNNRVSNEISRIFRAGQLVLDLGLISRDTTLGTAPAYPHVRILNRQSSNQGDIAYISMQQSNGTWDYVFLIEAP